MAAVRVYTFRAAVGLLLAAWTGVAAAEETAAFTVEPSMVRGPAAAPVTIFEWSDYQCPFCKNAQEALARLRAEFPDTLRIVFKDFPLRMHPLAVPAALAARCAGAQGRYWEYHDILFVAQPDFSREQLVGYARRLGLDVGAFTQCFDGRQFLEAIAADQREGLAAEVQGTPTFFINGQRVVGEPPLDEFRDAVRQALREANPRR
ncbi:MAG TPA: DsbA family protein [Methylomirabilota bacterium]|nr:DsbA family protein [Methylomirabilota bacterium]